MTDHFDFSHALSLLKQGKRVARKGWEEWGEASWLQLARDFQDPRLPDWRRPVLLLTGVKGEAQPMSLNAEHVLAEDWHEVTG